MRGSGGQERWHFKSMIICAESTSARRE